MLTKGFPFNHSIGYQLSVGKRTIKICTDNVKFPLAYRRLTLPNNLLLFLAQNLSHGSITISIVSKGYLFVFQETEHGIPEKQDHYYHSLS